MINFLAGELGTPPAGWPEPFRTKALEGRTVNLADEELSAEDREALDQPGAVRRATLNRLLFPGPTKDFESSRTKYGDVSVLHTRDFLYGLDQDHEHVISLGKGVRLLVTLQAISEPDEKGMRTVMVTLNGQLRLLEIRDESVKSQAVETEKADTSQPGHVAAPFSRRGHGHRLGGRHRLRRGLGGHDRGHEDGGLHHGSRGRNGLPRGARRHRARERRGPGPGDRPQ